MAKKRLFDKLLSWSSLIGAILFAAFCLYFIILILTEK